MALRCENQFFDGDILVFRIGSDLETFRVHARIILPQSEVFHKMMTGPFEEHVAGEAKLDVDPQTFTTFLAYAYSSSLRSYEQNNTRNVHTQKISISRLIEHLLQQQHTSFVCKSCCSYHEIRFAEGFPLCQRCANNEQNVRWGAGCIVKGCGKDGGYIEGLLCGKCLYHLGLANNEYGGMREGKLSDLRYDKPVRLDDIQEFRFDIPGRASDIIAMDENSSRRLLPTSNDILATVKFAIFADKYVCWELIQDTLKELYRQLAHIKLDEETVDMISEAARFVYESTGNETAGAQATEHKTLRLMLSQFIASHRKQFLASSTFKDLFWEGGDLPYNVLTAIP